MFSGIVESVQPIVSVQKGEGSLIRIGIRKPSEFNDLKIGDSLAADGVCLTVEAFNQDQITFALAAETLRVLQWSPENPERLLQRQVNLERSLRFGDRIHGHLVTGHVDSLGKVLRSEGSSENWALDIQVSENVLPFLWKKGSITLNGVSLTVNELQNSVVSVGLIPETLKRTNLGSLKKNDFVNVEPDYMAKALQRMLQTQKELHL
ncbi:MAG: riboflavin synthase [Pseudobdellovibrionaceae bacterium]